MNPQTHPGRISLRLAGPSPRVVTDKARFAPTEIPASLAAKSSRRVRLILAGSEPGGFYSPCPNHGPTIMAQRIFTACSINRRVRATTRPTHEGGGPLMPMLADIRLTRAWNDSREVLLGVGSRFGVHARLDDTHWEMEGASRARSNPV